MELVNIGLEPGPALSKVIESCALTGGKFQGHEVAGFSQSTLQEKRKDVTGISICKFLNKICVIIIIT